MANEKQQETSSGVPWYGYAALIFAIIFFSGIFNGAKSWLAALDFGVICGKFGVVQGLNDTVATFAGKAGTGARDSFLFSLGLFPSVMLALGVVEVVDHLGGLKAAQKLLSPILRPILGIPGIAGLALVSSLQSTDAGAGMTRSLRESKEITEKERLVFSAFQFSAGGTITNYLSTGAALFSFILVPIIVPLAVIFVFKIIGANIMRLYLKRFTEEELNQ